MFFCVVQLRTALVVTPLTLCRISKAQTSTARTSAARTRIFAEKPCIVSHYPGGMSRVDLALVLALALVLHRATSSGKAMPAFPNP